MCSRSVGVCGVRVLARTISGMVVGHPGSGERRGLVGTCTAEDMLGRRGCFDQFVSPPVVLNTLGLGHVVSLWIRVYDPLMLCRRCALLLTNP